MLTKFGGAATLGESISAVLTLKSNFNKNDFRQRRQELLELLDDPMNPAIEEFGLLN